MVVSLSILVGGAAHGCLPSLIDYTILQLGRSVCTVLQLGRSVCTVLQLGRSVCTVMMWRSHPGATGNRGNHGSRNRAVNLPFPSSPAISSESVKNGYDSRPTGKILSERPTFAFEPSRYYSTAVISA